MVRTTGKGRLRKSSFEEMDFVFVQIGLLLYESRIDSVFARVRSFQTHRNDFLIEYDWYEDAFLLRS